MDQFIAQLGLPPKESRVYLALLELGSSGVSAIAQKAGLNRTTCYDILEYLHAKSLVSRVGDTNKVTYTAEHPEALLTYYRKRSQQYSRFAEDLDRIVPQLRGLYNEKGTRPRIRFYEGTKGLEAVYEDTLTADETIRAYASVLTMHTKLPHFFPDYYVRRTKKGILIRVILPDTPEARERASHNTQEARESILVPADRFDFSPEINIYDDKVAILSLAEEFGVIIESKEIAEAQKKIFELAWIGAQSLQSHIKA